ncbi:hypothetical protein GCM10023196_036390 [Actinoallomurus vinaceus]|uniref:Uncharacterized protein n=1 Tax=Actinoallomurus vinaceus TaxID=1080074 RepID=A0ABP8UAK4_9ACTN
MAKRSHGDILDWELGKVRVLSKKCGTCILRPGNLMHLAPGRLQEIVEANLRAQALLTCHQTLPDGDHPEVPPAACAGFWDSYHLRTVVGLLAEDIGIVRVDPPEPFTGDEGEG